MFVNNVDTVKNAYIQSTNLLKEEKSVVPVQEEKAQVISPAYIVSLSGEKDKTEDLKEKEIAENKESSSSSEHWRRGKSDAEQKSIEKELQEYAAIEKKVIAHEQAHKAAGGQYTGAINYDKTQAPDGKQYIVGGDVSIDISEENTPEKTITKMQVVKSAAMAPADPSPQDRQVASTATQIEMSARQELSEQSRTDVQATQGKNEVSKTEEKKEFNVIEFSLASSAKKSEIGDKDYFGSTIKDSKARAQEPGVGLKVDISA